MFSGVYADGQGRVAIGRAISADTLVFAWAGGEGFDLGSPHEREYHDGSMQTLLGWPIHG